jgi:hypothetical protein
MVLAESELIERELGDKLTTEPESGPLVCPLAMASFDGVSLTEAETGVQLDAILDSWPLESAGAGLLGSDSDSAAVLAKMF